MRLFKSNISEPVYSIVNALKNRPKSFGIRMNSVKSESGVITETTVYDRVTGLELEEFRLATEDCYVDVEYITDFPVTKAERKFLVKHVHKWLDLKIERLNKKKREKWIKKYDNQRSV